MLESLRRNATGWMAKILIALLVLSFALWGVTDWIGGGGGQAELAKVGKTPITADEFQRTFRNEITTWSRQTGQQLSTDQARQFGLDTLTLSRLMNSTAIANHARSLGLALSDETLADGIRNDPSFQGPGGTFSKVDFEGLLRQAGLSEAAFLALRREDILRDQLISTVNAAVVPPRPMIDALHAYNEEMRIIEHLTIDPSKAAKPGEPDDAKLKSEYEATKARYMTPEFRKLAVLIAGIDQVRDRVTVSDEDVRTAYDQDKATYDVPERRRVQQINFKDRAAADAAKSTLAAGTKGFTEIAKDQGASFTDIDLGLLTREQLIDPKIRDAAFSIERDKVSDVIDGRFGPVLIRVVEIQPGKESTFDEVRDRVRDKLLRERARAELQTVHDEVDNERASGKTLREIGEALKLKFTEVEATDKTNKTPDGKTALEGGDAGIVEAGFRGDVGIESEAVDLTDNGFAWIDVLGITPPQQKDFEAVKAEVKAAFIDSETARLLAEHSGKIVDRANGGETLDALSKEFGGKPETTLAVTRKTVPQGLTEASVSLAFGLAKGKVAHAASADNKSRTILRVVDIKPAPAPTPEQVERLTTELRGQLQNDAIALYVAALRAQQGSTINDAAFKRLTGADGS